MMKDRLSCDIQLVTSASKSWNEMDNVAKRENLEKIILVISLRIRDLRQLFVRQNLALKKFRKEAGDNWRELKFVYAISSVQAQIFQIRTVVKKLLYVNDTLVKLNTLSDDSCTNGSQTASIGTVELSSQENCVFLKQPDEIPSDVHDELRFLKQRSEGWHEKRKQYKVTGSSMYSALGLDGLKKQQKHFDLVVKGISAEEIISKEVQARMDHVTNSEINAVATLTHNILPFVYPDLKYVEEGAHAITRNGEPFIIVFPDGSLCKLEVNSNDLPVTVYGCEFKCPVPAEYKTPVHYKIPLRYITQLLGEMASMGVNQLIYLCWSEESSTVFRAHFDVELWNSIQEEAAATYIGTDLKRPSKRSQKSKTIEADIIKYRDSHTELLCEIPSVRGCYSGPTQTTDSSPYLFQIVTIGNDRTQIDVDAVMNATVSSIQEAHQICRKKATEVLVWLLSDTERIWDPDMPHSTPVGYAMKGYSLPVKPMRDMHEHIFNAYHYKGLNVVCSCFDGQ